ncbi:prolyl oligopeptidase family serine peptidase [Rubrivirga sp. IMCC43871]|uniref:prolyl oligopeptidase family serine peptidase n=1 Tax=Rubrivirga sp. IMCC43871 TaxID=3391575 RepID=UPI00398FAC8B
MTPMLRPLLAALVLLAAPAALAQAPFTVDDVFSLEWAEDPQISPDGEHVVYARAGMDRMTDKRRRSLWIVGTDGTGHRKLTVGEGGEGSPRWSPSGDRVAYVASTDEGAELYVRWQDTGQTARLTQLDRSPAGLAWSPDGTMLAFSMLVPEKDPTFTVTMPAKPKGAEWADAPRIITRVRHEADGSGDIEPGHRHLFVVPADGGTPRQVTTGDYQHGADFDWLPDASGLMFSANRSADWELDFRASELYRVGLADTTVTTLTDRDGPDRSPAVSPDGRHVAYLGFDDRVRTFQNTRLSVRDLRTGATRVLAGGLDRSLGDITWDADGDGLYATYLDRGATRLMWVGLDGDVREITDALGGLAISRPYTSGAYSVADDGTVAFTHGTADRPSDVAVVVDGETRVLTDLNGDVLAHRQLGPTEEITWQSADGLEIQGWITRPPNAEPGRRYPLLVENHGGPIAAYGPQFSAEVQLYAAADYVVFTPNPRGSTGYGEAFADLLYHDYPGGDFGDIMAGVDAVLATGAVHPDSLYVTGGSAGGTMTAWMVGNSDRFRAAAVIKPVVNWISKTLVADNYYGYADYRYPGQPWENPMAYWQDSPISVVAQIQTPTMVMVGTDDRRTPPSEARQLYHALRLRGVETAYIEIPGASHNIANRPSQLAAKVAYILAWFEQYRGVK